MALSIGSPLGGENVYDGTAFNTIINTGGVENVSRGGTTTLTYDFGGALNINGGTAGNTTIDTGGVENVNGGKATYTTINYFGVENVNGGTATNTIINEYGVEDVYSGGTTTHTTIHVLGILYVDDGSTATDTTINGGTETVNSGGTANNVIFAGVNSTLELAIPSGLKGTISNWHAGDVIDFLKTTVTGVHETGNALTVIYGNNQTESYSLASKELNTEFHLQSDGHGGTDLILLHVVGIAQAQHDAAGHLVLERPGLSDSKAASKKFCAHKRGLFFPFSKLTQGGRG